MQPKTVILGFFLLTQFLTGVFDPLAAASPPPLEVPLAEVPFSFAKGYTFPSMHQALSLTKDFYYVGHKGLTSLFPEGARLGPALSIFSFDVLSLWMPLGASWLHEEWHRAILSRRGFDSYDGVYDMHFFSSETSVYRVLDEDLIRLKDDHPYEHLRLSTAGIESQYELVLSIEKDHYFGARTTYDTPLYWLNYWNNIGYLNLCGSNEGDALTDEMNRAEGSDVSKRDFTGLDCTAWVYDLFRPHEPFTARGPHPYGKGINRYRKTTDLTEGQRSFLKSQLYLSFLNMTDPFLYFSDSYLLSRPWLFSLRHHITPFGYALDVNVFSKFWNRALFFIWHTYVNQSHYFPGVELEAIRVPFGAYFITARINFWSQPRGMGFTEEQGELGCLASARFAKNLSGNVEGYLDLEGKTQGWSAGNLFLDSNLTVRAGLLFGNLAL